MTMFRGRRRSVKRRAPYRVTPTFKRMRIGGKKFIKSGRGVTRDTDRTVIYRRKRMPRRKKLRWKSFRKKVNYIAEKTLGTRTIVMNDSLAESNSTAGDQAVAEWALYPCDALTGTFSVDHLKDLTKIAFNDTSIPKTGKLMFQSGILDMTVQNKSTADAIAVGCELDIYEIISSRNWDDNVAVDGGTTSIEQGTLKSLFEYARTHTDKIDAAGNAISITSRGATPWDFPQVLGQYRLKILKKSKYFLGANQTCTYQIRDPKRHVFDKLALDPSEIAARPRGANLKGVTRWLLLVAKGLPADVADAVAHTVSIQAGVTRKYTYKVNEDTQDLSELNPT